MATKTNIRKSATASKAGAKTSTKASPKRASKRKAATPVVAESITGLNGLGLLRLADTSRLELRDRLAMTRPMFGRLVDVSERTIADAEGGNQPAKKLARTYNEVYRLWEALSDVVNPDCLGQWFQTPNDAFDGLKPVEVIERGEIDRLWNMVFRLQTGMPG